MRLTPAFVFYEALGAMKSGRGGEKMCRAAGELICDGGGAAAMPLPPPPLLLLLLFVVYCT